MSDCASGAAPPTADRHAVKPAAIDRRRHDSAAGCHLLLPASAWPRGQVYYFCPRCTAIHALSATAPATCPACAEHSLRDIFAEMAARLERAFGFFDATRGTRHPWLFTPAPGAPAPVLSISSMALGAFGELRALGFTPPRQPPWGSDREVLEAWTGAILEHRDPGYQPAAGSARRRHHRRRGGIPGALRLLGIRVATTQPGVHGRSLPAAGRRAVQPRLPRHGRPGAPLAGGDLGRAPAVDRRKLDLQGGGDPPSPAGHRPGRGDRLRPAVAGGAPGPHHRSLVRGRRVSRTTTWSTASSSCS